MNTKIVPIIAISALLLIYLQSSIAKTVKETWLSGQVASSSVSGQGSATEDRSKPSSRRDIWWNYCISANGLFYSVSSRQSPTKLGLTNNSLVSFVVKKNRMYVLNKSGSRVALTILRKDKSCSCP